MADEVTGYEKLARFMGTYPQLAIFRRFGALNLQNVLYLQAEIASLEQELQQIVAEDNLHPERTIFSRDWYVLANSADTEEGGPARTRYQMILRIRKLLNDYNNALTQQAAILALQPPAEDDLHFLRVWLNSPQLGNNFLIGPESATWQDGKLSPGSDKKFSNRVTDFLITLLTSVLPSRVLGGNEMVGGLVDYSSSTLLLLMQIVIAILSSVLLMISVVVLYFVHSSGVRLAIIGVFTVSFSLGLAFFTGANRNEIFTATAACIAVQIVFVGTN